MKIQKSKIAILLGAIFFSATNYAADSLSDSIKIEVEAAKFDVTKPQYAEFSYPLLSGDGKTILFSQPSGDSIDELIDTNRIVKVLFDNRKKQGDVPHNIDGSIFGTSISKDGSVILHTSKKGFYLRNDDKYVFHSISEKYPNMSLLLVTGDGLLFAYDRDTNKSTLLDPHTLEMKKVHDGNIVETEYLSINHDGSVVVETISDTKKVFYGDKWNKQAILEAPKTTERLAFPVSGAWNGFVNSTFTNPEGNIVAISGDEGWVYSGEDFKKKDVLPKKVGDKENKENGVWLLASNQDGSIIGGGIGRTNGERYLEELEYLEARPILWYGDKWSKTKDIGTLGGKDTDLGIVYSITYDGKVAAGMSTNAEGKFVPTIWRLIDESTQPALVDPEQMKKTIEKVGQKAFNLFQNQRYGLVNLLEGCRVENGQGHYCVSLRSSLWGQKQDREAKAGVSMAYALTDKFSVGGVIEHSIYSDILDTNKHRNLGLGLFAEWKTKQGNKEFYIRPALSFNRYHGNLERPMESGTEYGYGKINLKGTALSLTLGEKYNLATDVSLDWFAGVRYMNLKQKGYQDSAKAFPIEYKGMKYEEASIFAGLGLSKALTSKLNWLSKVEVEQVIHQRNPQFSAHNPYLGKVELERKLARNAVSLSSGLEYQLNNNFRVSLVSGITKASAQPLRWNVGLNLTGQF